MFGRHVTEKVSSQKLL